ncbi:MAG: hypothetical protein RRA94_12995 [Bacteroidota bacterium]|nr:hypothetical protein [Bacteroidota bacterium]
MKRRFAPIAAVLFVAASMTFMGCNTDHSPVTPEPATEQGSTSLMKAGRGQIWADDILFNTVTTPATFNSTSGDFDELYNVGVVGGEFKDGIGAISEAKPGDMDYNGGRWHVNVLKSGVDPFKYDDASSVDDLDLADFESTSIYFECPLLPMNRRP